jgi:hypothetical protein
MATSNVTLDERLAGLLEAWRRDICSEPVPKLVDLAVAVALVRGKSARRVCPPTTYPPGPEEHRGDHRDGRKLNIRERNL